MSHDEMPTASWFDVRRAAAGSVTYAPGGTFGPRVQQDLQLVLVITGSMTVSIDGRPYAVPAGHTALLKPNHHEAFQFDTHRNTLHLWINVSPDGLPPSLLDGFNALPLALPLSDEMNRLAELMLALQRSGSAPEADVIRTLGWAAMQLFLEEHRRISANVRKHPSVLVTKDEIRIRYADNLSLNDLARAAGLSPEHLIRLFRRDEGVTPIQYLWRYRLQQGLGLLRSTGLSISEVSGQAGFKTVYHFTRMIKRQTGMTPSEIRREALLHE